MYLIEDAEVMAKSTRPPTTLRLKCGAIFLFATISAYWALRVRGVPRLGPNVGVPTKKALFSQCLTQLFALILCANKCQPLSLL